jgi:virulence-associated protein E
MPRAKPEDNVVRLAEKPAAAPPSELAFPGLDLVRNDKGRILPIEANVISILRVAERWAGLYFDTFLRRLRLRSGAKTVDWTDDQHLELLDWLQRSGLPTIRFEAVKRAVRQVANERARDSLRDFYTDELPAWDGIERIETALIEGWGCEDTPVVRAAAVNLLRAMAARAIWPGAKVDTITVFEGPQGTLKSQSMAVLGGPYYAEISAPIGSADFMREIRSINLGELSELNALHGRESQTIKTMLSRTEDRFVEKYEAEPRARARRHDRPAGHQRQQVAVVRRSPGRHPREAHLARVARRHRRRPGRAPARRQLGGRTSAPHAKGAPHRR